MGNEFKLEDYESDIKGMYHEEHIILFIRELKKKLKGRINYSTTMGNQMFMEEIDKLAGTSLCR